MSLPFLPGNSFNPRLKRHGGPCTSSPTNARSATVGARVRSTDVSSSSSGSGQAGSSAILTRTSGGVARVFADIGSKLPPSYSDPTSTCMSSDLLENEEPGNRATNDTSCFLGEEIVTCVDASGIERNPDHESSHTRSDGDDTDSEQGGNFPENSDNSEQGGNFLDSSDNSKQGGNFPESSDDSEHGDNSEQGGNFPESSDDSEQGDNSEQGGNFPESSDDSEHSDNSEQGGNFPESSDDSEHGDADPDDDDPEGDIDGDEPMPGPDDDDPDDDDPEGDIDGDEPMPGPEIDETLNVPLYEGSSVTKAEALLMVLSFVMRHCLSSIAVCHLFELLNVLVGKYLFQSTKSILRHIFCNDVIQLSFHFYCISCYSFVRSFQCVSEENISCPQCTNPCIASDLSQGNFFVTANLGSQVRNLFERADIAPHLSYRDARHKQHEDNIEDIYDGEIYKKMREDGQPLSNPNNFSFTFNSDGMPVFKSSKYSLWPIYIMINELPPKLRFNNLILAGVWFGKVEPKMEVFLEKFTIEANKLSEEGVFWKRGEEIINSKLYGLCCCADAPARSAMQNTIRFNGYSGCGLCYHPGKIVDRVIKYPIDVCDYVDRTDEEMVNDMEEAMNTNRTVRGVKGPSALINLNSFRICWGFPVDFMHALLLGVTRQLSELWFSSPAISDFYIGSQRVISVINDRMKSIKPPSTIARAPRPLSERKYWKASEWYTWLIFYSVPCLKGILPNLYWQHLVILVEASFLLLQKSISNVDLEKSDVLMFTFVCRCQLLYGASAMTFNMHSLTHLSKSAKLWGPLWTHSCFPFENANWVVKRQQQGNRGVIIQVVRKFLTLQSLPLFIEHHFISPRIRIFSKKILNLKRKGIDGEAGVQMLGSGKLRDCTAEERDALSTIGYIVDDGQVLPVYSRLRKNGMYFCSASYRAETMTRNNRLVVFADGKVGDLLSVFLINDQCVMIVKCLFLQEDVTFADDESNAKLSHLKICTGYADVSAIHAQEAIGNCVSMNINGVHYIGFFPNYVAMN